MTTSCLEKQTKIQLLFSALQSPEDKYNELIKLGKSLPLMDPRLYTAENIVPGCQSILYLHASYDITLHFTAHSDALISRGLAALLVHIYNDELPETILSCPPTVLKEIGIIGALSPTRALGLRSIYQKMQQCALLALQNQTS